jgi:hypothetical protein
MTPLNIDFDRLSNDELADWTARFCRQLVSRGHLVEPLAIPGEDQRPISFLVPAPPGYDPPSEEFLAELRRRMADPNTTFLTVDEFFAALDAEPSGTPRT